MFHSLASPLRTHPFVAAIRRHRAAARGARYIVEFELKGTHDGPLGDVPPTGKAFTCRMVAFFLFEEDQLVCERVYFDAATIAAQLGLTP